MILPFFLLAALPTVLAQNTGDPIVYDLQHNITSLVGTWSTGSMHVVPGPDFASPAEVRFTYPSTTGVGVSFSDDGWYEYAQYSFVSNATDPTCITGYMLWSHGTYTNEVNGSMFLIPNGDGYQQVQKTCAAVSNLIENNNDTIVVNWWNINQDTELGFVLTMQKFDGTYWAPFKQYSTSPNMLPTQKLRNVTQAPDVSIGARSLEERSSAAALRTSLVLMGAALVFGLLSIALFFSFGCI
ncbi:hypothetical protein BDZ89DRAFT_961231 [Hymenopellis radicata]|nr:hypothetical protein BDZ89DRAFT_961231 [Hymenopellis radicata]